NNDIELLTKLADLEQIASEQLEIAQRVPLLKESLVSERGFREVEPDHLVLGVHVRCISGLHRPAASDEDAKPALRAPAWPQYGRVQRRIADLVIAFANLLAKVGKRLGIGERLVLPRNQGGHILHEYCLAEA